MPRGRLDEARGRLKCRRMIAKFVARVRAAQVLSRTHHRFLRNAPPNLVKGKMKKTYCIPSRRSRGTREWTERRHSERRGPTVPRGVVQNAAVHRRATGGPSTAGTSPPVRDGLPGMTASSSRAAASGLASCSLDLPARRCEALELGEPVVDELETGDWRRGLCLHPPSDDEPPGPSGCSQSPSWFQRTTDAGTVEPRAC